MQESKYLEGERSENLECTIAGIIINERRLLWIGTAFFIAASLSQHLKMSQNIDSMHADLTVASYWAHSSFNCSCMPSFDLIYFCFMRHVNIAWIFWKKKDTIQPSDKPTEFHLYTVEWVSSCALHTLGYTLLQRMVCWSLFMFCSPIKMSTFINWS